MSSVCLAHEIATRLRGCPMRAFQYVCFQLTLLRSLRVEIRQYGLHVCAVALRTTGMGFLVFSDMLAALEHFAAFGAAILIGGHRRFLDGSRASVAGKVRQRSVTFDQRSARMVRLAPGPVHVAGPPRLCCALRCDARFVRRTSAV